MRRFYFYILYLLLVWGAFRYFVRLPEVIEELWFKPVIWLVPIFWWNLSLAKPILFFEGTWWKSVGLGVLTGLFYWILFAGFKNLSWDYLGVVLATSITEEMVFSGFLASYVSRYLKEYLVLLVIGLIVALSRLPILIFVYKLSLIETLGVLLIVFSSGMIHAFLRLRTKNVWGAIVARIFLGLVK